MCPDELNLTQVFFVFFEPLRGIQPTKTREAKWCRRVFVGSIMDPWTKKSKHQLPTELCQLSAPNKIWEKTISKESGERWDLALHLFQVNGGLTGRLGPTAELFFSGLRTKRKMGSTVGIPLNVSKWKCKNRGTIWRMRRCVSFFPALDSFFFESNLMGQAKESTNTSDQWRLF